MITFNKKKTAQPKPEIDKHYKSDFKHLLRIRDLTPQELSSLVLDAYKIKMANSKKIATTMTVGKKAVSFFSKSSSRTKSSWEVACSNLGIFSSFNNATDSQLGNKESIADSAKVFSQYYDIAGWRCMKYEDILTFANNASVPCVNLLCDQNHPTQAICDLLTILVHFRRIKGIKIAFIGACNNNVARSLIEGILMCGGSYVGIGPKAAHPTQEELSFYQSLASQYGGTVKFSTDLIEVQGVDVIYQDVFLDLGEQFNLWPSRLALYHGYQVTKDVMAKAKKECIYMHCLPAINGSDSNYSEFVKERLSKKFPWVSKGEVEVTAEVFNSANSVVFQQAQNRLFAMEAILRWLLAVNHK